MKPASILAGVLALAVIGIGSYVMWTRAPQAEQPAPVPAQAQPQPNPAPPDNNKVEPERPAPQPVTPQRERAAPPAAKPAPPVKTRAEDVKRLMGKANAELNAGKYEEAIRSFEAALLLEPDNREAQDSLARAKRAKAAEDAILTKPPDRNRPS